MVALPYGSSIGYAIGRLIRPFLEAACRVSGSHDHVHFCFGRIDGTSEFLPKSFSNVVGIDIYGEDVREARKLEAYVMEHQIDTLFAFDLPVEASILKRARRAGITTVISYWGASQSGFNSGLRLLMKRLEVRYLRPHRPDLYIFESHAMMRTATHGRGISTGHVMVVNTGVDPEVFKPKLGREGVVYEVFGIPSERKVVVFMGHLTERKGVRVLLRAADHIVGSMERNDLHFLFLGNREGQEQDFVEDFGPAVTGGLVTFGGYRTNIPELLTGCYVGCIPSNGWDSFPMSSLEMQACGLPVVVSDLQGTPETIEDGRSGVVVSVNDHVALAEALTGLADDPIQRDAYAEYARERIVNGLTVGHQIDRLAYAMARAVELKR